MTPLRSPASSLRILLLAGMCALLGGCGDLTKVDDPELKPIQEMLYAQLPPGTPLALETQFVNTRGYPIEPAGKPSDMAIIIRHIDQQKLRPVTARITFHFDKNDKLIKTDIVRTMNEPIPQPQQAGPHPETQSAPQADHSATPPQ